MRPVCPPRLGRRASGRSFSMISVSDCDRQRLDVGDVRHAGVGHDRGRVGVDQDDLVAEAAQGLAGLGSGIIELAGLADDDGAGADNQHFLDVIASGHRGFLYGSEIGEKLPGLGRTTIRTGDRQLFADHSESIFKRWENTKDRPGCQPFSSAVF